MERATETDAESASAVDLYERLLSAWNSRRADDFAELFGETGSCIGFDGTEMNGRAEIRAHVRAIFEHHATAAYVAKVREVRPLGARVTLLRAVAGMIPPGSDAIDAAANAVQSFVIVGAGADARIALFQNTPATFHRRPEATERLTTELTEVTRAGRLVDAG